MSTLSPLGSWLVELRRRHVFRVAAVYTVVAWVLIQAAVNIFPYLGLPDMVITAVIAMLLVGFPIALVLAWAFDLTPEGLQRSRSATAVLLPSAAAPPAPARDGRVAIAALPFLNHGPGPDDYFSDGLTEELINALTKVDGLRVAARTSAFAFKGTSADVREIARKLEVDVVLEGSVRRQGQRLRMTVRLIDASDGKHLLGQEFDREIGDVFAVQEEIARSIVDALQVRRLGAAPPPLGEAPPRDFAAYTLYLRGRFFWHQRTERALRRSVELFTAALERDPGYARAHAGLADAYSLLLDYGLEPPERALPAAVAAAERAVAIDPGLAEAHAALAHARLWEWDWPTTEAAFARALELNPGYATAYQRFALFLAWTGRPVEALRAAERALQLDPLSLVAHATVGWIHYYARRPEAAERQLRDTLDLSTEFIPARVALGLSLLALRRPDAGVSELETASRLAGEGPGVLPLLGLAYGRAGRLAEAESVRQRLLRTAEARYVSAYHIAVAHLGTGDEAGALDWLERALVERSAPLVYLGADPLWDVLRPSPRFGAVLLAIGLQAGTVRDRGR